MSQHAKLSGSTAHRWMNCPGSIRLCNTVERRGSSAAALEGTFAHAVAEYILRVKNLNPGDTFAHDGDARVVTAEMLEHVMTYVNRVSEIKSSFGAELHLEKKVNLKRLVRDGMFGTADTILTYMLNKKTRRVHVIDFKYGYTPVFVEDEHGLNPQLLYYAAGACDALGWPDEVYIEIVQPRSNEVDTIQTRGMKASWVKNWAETTLWEASHATDALDAPLVVGPWCRWCDALAVCPAQQRETNQLAATDFQVLAPVVPENPVDLAKVLRAAPRIDAWLKACTAEAQSCLERGGKINGFKLVRKKSNREWPENMTEKQFIAELRKLGYKKAIAVGRDLVTEPELLSPAQMEKVVGKKLVDAVAVKPDNGLTLAAESDRREAINPASDFEELV